MRIRLYNDNPDHQKIIADLDRQEAERRAYAAEERARITQKEREQKEILNIMLQNQQILIAIGATLEQLLQNTKRAEF